MHFYSQKNRAAGHAPLAPDTGGKQKNNIRENKHRPGLVFSYFCSLLPICLKLQGLNNVGFLHTDIIKWHTSFSDKTRWISEDFFFF